VSDVKNLLFFSKLVGRGRFRLFRQFWFGLNSNNFRYLHDTIIRSRASASLIFDQPGDGCFNVDKREFVDQFLAFRTCLALPQQASLTLERF
jgi:hypothetical protein